MRFTKDMVLKRSLEHAAWIRRHHPELVGKRVAPLPEKVKPAPPALHNGYAVRSIQLQLSDKKVIAFFGKRLETGYPLPFTDQRAAGLKWSQFKKQYVPNPVDKQLILTGRRVSKNVWLMTIPRSVFKKVVAWLLHQHGTTNPWYDDTPKKKRKSRDRFQRPPRVSQGTHFHERIDCSH